MEERLHAAEARLWELSLLPDRDDMLLPPSLLRAALQEARSERSKPGRASARLPSQRHELPPPPTATAVRSVASPRARPGHAVRPHWPQQSEGGSASPRRHLPSRAAVVALEDSLNRRLREEGETVAAFDAALEGLSEQVGAHCAQQGELLARVRRWLLRHIWWQERELRAAREVASRAAEDAEAASYEVERALSLRRGSAAGARRSSMAGSFAGDEDLDGASPLSAARRQSKGFRRSLGGGAHALLGGASISGASVLSEEDLPDVSGDDVLQHFESLGDAESSALLEQLVDGMASSPGRLDALSGALARSMPRMHADELADALHAAVGSSTAEWRSTTVGASIAALHGASASEATAVLRDEVAGWPAKDATALVLAIHKQLDEVARLHLLTSLEPQLGDEECEYLADACAKQRSVIHSATQTDVAGVAGWPRVLAEMTELEEGARIKLLQTITTQGGWSPRELALFAQIGSGNGAVGVPPRPATPGGTDALSAPGATEDAPPAGADASGAKGRRKGKRAGAAGKEGRGEGDESDLLSEKDLKGTLHPEEMLLRVIGEIWAKKIFEDHQLDTRGKPRMDMKKFARDFFMRQYGVRAVALKAVGDFVLSVRQYLAAHAAAAAGRSGVVAPRLENIQRLALFGAMIGLQHEGGACWRPKKVNFFLFFLSGAVGREVAAAGSGVAQGRDGAKADGKGALRSEAIKERLTKRKSIVRLSSVVAELTRCVADTAERQMLVEKAQAMAFDDVDRQRGSADRLAVEIDNFMSALMTAWDESEVAVERSRRRRLDDMVRARLGGPEARHGEDDTELISYDDFEQLVKDIRSVANVETHEEHLEMLMDMFDEALQESEKVLGEASDVVALQAFVTVAGRYGLMELLETSAYVDPLHMSLEDREQQQAQQQQMLLVATDVAATADEPSADTPAADRTSGGRGLARLRRAGAKVRAVTALQQAARGGGTTVPEKAPYVFAMVKKAVESNFLFKHLQDNELRRLVERLREVRCTAGRVVCREGDKGDYFYVAESGSYGVYKGGELVHTYQITEGAYKPSFGELALMYAKPRAATVRCIEPGTLWALDRTGFREAQKKSAGIDVIKALSKVSELSVLRFDQLQQLRDRMSTRSYAAGEPIIVEGDVGDTFYVILRGSAVVRKRRALTNANSGAQEVVEEDVAVLSELTSFGEAALLKNEPRNASVVASEELSSLTLDRATFEAVLGPLQAIIDAQMQARDAAARFVQQQQQAAGLSTVTRGMFKLRRQVCVRASGAVLFVASHERQEAGAASKEYTMRVESISQLAKTGAQAEVLAEAATLRALRLQMSEKCAPLPSLLTTFRDERALYWVFGGGRALCSLEQLNAHARLDEAAILYALSCVTAALDALHSRQYVLRGVATPLLMVDDGGVVVVVELRYSRELSPGESSYSLAGLPEYLAPEQVRGEGHTYAVDWWALGVLLYELACGRSPFEKAEVLRVGDGQATELDVAQAILEFKEGELQWSDSCTVAGMTQELIEALLVPDPARRLGGPTGQAGAAQVKGANALLGVDWKPLVQGAAPSPLAARAAALVAAEGASAGDDDVREPAFAQPSAADMAWCADF